MFNQPLEYKFVQRNTNKHGKFPYRFEYIYRFFYQDKKLNRRKYIVQIKEYSNTHFTVDFYTPLSSKEKDFRNFDISKYRYTTNAGGANRIAVTVFAILGSLRRDMFPDMSFGLQAASMVKEKSDKENRRYKAYQQILASVTGASQNFWEVFGYPEDSYIFVVQSRFSESRTEIIEEYGRIFGKIFPGQEEASSPV